MGDYSLSPQVEDTPKPSKKKQETCERIIAALEGTGGLMTVAARKAGISYPTLKRYAAEFPQIREAVQNAKDAMLDFTEGKLFENIKNGETTSIIFFLKTQGKHRGYIERQEVSGANGGPIKHEVDPRSKLIDIVTSLAARIAEETSDKEIHQCRN